MCVKVTVYFYRHLLYWTLCSHVVIIGWNNRGSVGKLFLLSFL